MNDGDRTSKAFDFASDATKQLITLATAIVTVTVTFGTSVFPNAPSWVQYVLFSAWFAYLVSIALGILTLQALTGTLDP
jgi:hypothetical protein